MPRNLEDDFSGNDLKIMQRRLQLLDMDYNGYIEFMDDKTRRYILHSPAIMEAITKEALRRMGLELPSAQTSR